MTGSMSSRRRVRSEAAQNLLRLHEAGVLAEPELWTWEVVDRLPLWTLLDVPQRERVQRVAGAVLLAPEMRLWISDAQLREAERLLGAEILAAVLQRADELAVSQATDPGEFNRGVIEAAATPMPPEGLEARLMSAGASVLTATLHESLPVSSLADALGSSAGDLPEPIALRLLAEAEAIIAREFEPESAPAANVAVA